MNILHVTNNYTPYSGGVVSSLHALLPAQERSGHTVRLVTLDFVPGCLDDPEYVVRIPSFFRFHYRKNIIAVPFFSKVCIDQIIAECVPDIIHCHHPYVLGPSALKVAKERSIPVVFTHHTLYEAYAHYLPLPLFLGRALSKKYARRFCHAVDGIIVPSASIKHYLELQGIIRPFRIIPSGLQSEFVQKMDRTFKKSKSPYFNLLLVSRFVPEKNIACVLDMMQMLPENFRLTLVGYGPLYDQLQNYAFTTLQLGERVRFVHRPTKDVLINEYQQGDLFVFPSLTDTQGVVIAEAMALGNPVIALPGPGQEDSIRNGYNGYIVESIQKMADTIQMIADDTDLYVTLCDGAYQTAVQYAPDQMAQDVIDFYQEIIG